MNNSTTDIKWRLRALRRKVRNAFEVGSGFLFVILVPLIFYFGYRYSCSAAWKDSGISYRWEAASGCQLEIEAGRWIPAASYKFVDLGE